MLSFISPPDATTPLSMRLSYGAAAALDAATRHCLPCRLCHGGVASFVAAFIRTLCRLLFVALPLLPSLRFDADAAIRPDADFHFAHAFSPF